MMIVDSALMFATNQFFGARVHTSRWCIELVGKVCDENSSLAHSVSIKDKRYETGSGLICFASVSSIAFTKCVEALKISK